MKKKQRHSNPTLPLISLVFTIALLHTGCGFSAPTELTVTMREKTSDVASRYKATGDDFSLKLDDIIWTDINEDGQIDGISINGKDRGYTLAGLSCGQDFNEPPASLYDGSFQFRNIQEGNGMYHAFYSGSDDSEYSNCTIRVRFTNHIISIAMSDDSVADEEQAATDSTPVPVPSPTPVPTSTLQSVYRPYPGYLPDDEDDYDTEADDYDEEDDSYIIPDSDTRKLTKADIEGLTSSELRIARNEIYARHGRMFQDAELQTYFDMQDWYVGTIAPEDFVDSEQLSKLERRNAKFIKKYE